jgi:hypothetical protein
VSSVAVTADEFARHALAAAQGQAGATPVMTATIPATASST